MQGFYRFPGGSSGYCVTEEGCAKGVGENSAQGCCREEEGSGGF